ncbi:MAG: ArsR/SmtB family transcription factor [Eubacteriaceae bacterium]
MKSLYIENMKNVSELLKVLSNENRLVIVCYLLSSPMTVTELHNKINNLTQSAISQHLSILKAHKLLDSEKKGQSITYFINDERVRNIIEVLKENYCNL